MALKEYDHEDLIDEVRTILTNNLNTEIATINAVKNDAFVISNPKAIYFGLRQIDPNVAEGKSIIIVTPSTIEGVDFNPGVTEDETMIDVIVVLWENKSEKAERKVLRYVKAIRSVLDKHALHIELSPYPSNVSDSVVSGIDFTPTDFEGDLYFKSASIHLRAKTKFGY